MTKVGKKQGKDKFRCWIENETGQNSYDFVKDITNWMYTGEKGVTFDDTAKENDDDNVKVTEDEYTGIWFLENNKNLNHVELDKDEATEVFVTQIPNQYHSDPLIIKAKEDELQKWEKYDAYETVDFENQPTISCKWVVTEKGGRVKARLCVRGFEEERPPQSDSPTASQESYKLFLSIAANEDFKLKSLDVNSAFLQGSPLERDIFMQPPPEKAEAGKIWKLKKSCYGLYDASRKWFQAVKEQLLKVGMKNVSGDEAFFYMHDEKDGMSGLCILHVDDFLIAGTPKFHDKIAKQLRNRFSFGKIEMEDFKFTGLKITQSDSEILIDQNEFVQSLKAIEIKRVGQKDDALTKEEYKEYRRLTG